MNSRSEAEALAELADTLAHVIETCAGHRAQAERAGFDTHTASRMALHVHALLITIYRNATQTKDNTK